MRAIGISRVSRENRRGNGHSPEVQRRLIESFAERQGWVLLDLLNENEIRSGNVSGASDPRKRPGFGPALERVERREARIIVAADLSRLFRDIDHQRATITAIEAAGGEFWTVANGRVSHDTAEAELTANIQGSVNHYQRRYAEEKSWLAVEIAIEEGRIPWWQTAPGYVRNGDSTLTPDARLKPVIIRAFKMRRDGATIEDVRRHLRNHGIVKSYHGVQHLFGIASTLGRSTSGGTPRTSRRTSRSFPANCSRPCRMRRFRGASALNPTVCWRVWVSCGARPATREW
jgi:DNA invertase Pin-like site-specific DNA recombinase